MFQKHKFIFMGILIVMASVLGSLVTSLVWTNTVSASVPEALLAAGSTRYAFTQKSDQLNITAPQIATWVDAGMTTSVAIPSGKHADVVVLFCSQAGADGNFITVRAKIGSTYLEPSQAGNGVNLIAGSAVQNQCISFQKAGVTAGPKNVVVQWYAVTTNSHLFVRSLVVILNIH